MRSMHALIGGWASTGIAGLAWVLSTKNESVFSNQKTPGTMGSE